eukprot:1462774-Amphidinium_carterae.1
MGVTEESEKTRQEPELTLNNQTLPLSTPNHQICDQLVQMISEKLHRNQTRLVCSVIVDARAADRTPASGESCP